MLIAGIDIGGVNVKAALAQRGGDQIELQSASFPLDGELEIEETLREVLDGVDRVVASETVSFSRTTHRTYREGVLWACDLLERALGAERVRMVGVDYRLQTLDEARQHIWSVACRNWVATTYLVAQHLGLLVDGLVVDCGTSSLDVIPVVGGRPVLLDGDDDHVWTRLSTGELALTGMLLTSAQALTSRVSLRGREFTTRSLSACMVGHARVAAGEISVSETVPGESDDVLTPTRSRRLLCELVGADETLLDADDLSQLARDLLRRQQEHVAERVQAVRRRCRDQLGRSLDQAVLAGLGARHLLAPALADLGLGLSFLDGALARSSCDLSRLESNTETALGAALLGMDDEAWQRGGRGGRSGSQQ